MIVPASQRTSVPGETAAELGPASLAADSSSWEPWEDNAFQAITTWVWADHGNGYAPSDHGPGNHLIFRLVVPGGADGAGKTQQWSIAVTREGGHHQNGNFVITTADGDGDKMQRTINYLATLSTTPGVSPSLFDYI